MKDQLASIHRQGTFVRMPEPGVKLKDPLGSQKKKKIHLQSKRGSFTLTQHPAPKPVQHDTKMYPQGPLVSPV